MAETEAAEPASGRGPATVVIGQHVKAGRSDDYRQWQDTVNAAASKYPGYLGTEVTPPADELGDWTVIYRFDTVEHLNDWLTSTTRQQLLERSGDVFDAATQQVVVGGDSEKFATVVVSHPVRPEDEKPFLAWQQRMTQAERRFPGFSGSELFPPVPGVQDEWTAVYRFVSADDLDRWLESDERKVLLREGEQFQDFHLRKITHSFGSWFSFGDDGSVAAGPPSWKTAISVLVGLYPTVVFLRIVISEIWKSAQLWQSLLLGNILSVALLTWVVMPGVTRVLRFWLVPADGAQQPRTDRIGLVVSVAILTVTAVVLWLVTVVVWTLP